MKTVLINNIEYKHTKALGNYGEALVTSLLLGAINMNVPFQKALPYDVLWNDIKINVKFCSKVSPSGRASFNMHYSDDHRNVIFVCVAHVASVYRYFVTPGIPGLPRAIWFDRRRTTDGH